MNKENTNNDRESFYKNHIDKLNNGNQTKLISQDIVKQVIEVLLGEEFVTVRPKWLNNPKTNRPLELDGYSEKLNIAFEYQGKQHYQPIEYFGGEESFKKLTENDSYKKLRCEELGIVLIEVPYLRGLPFKKSSNELKNEVIDWVANCLHEKDLTGKIRKIKDKININKSLKIKTKKYIEPQERKYEVKKSSELISQSANLTSFQRKLMNVLLAYAYNDIPNVQKHEIQLSVLKYELGMDGNNNQYVRDAFNSLNCFSYKEAFSRVFKYSFSDDMKKMIYQPANYAMINLQTQRRFGGYYSLALFENVEICRFDGYTSWKSIEEWKELLGVQYNGCRDEFKIFNRDVIKTSVKEVNKITSLKINPEYSRINRKIVAIRFAINSSCKDFSNNKT